MGPPPAHGLVEQFRRGLEAMLGLYHQQDRFNAERVQDVAITRVSRRRHRNPVAGVECRQERQKETR